MALQAIEAAPKDGNPVFLVDLDTSEMTAADWAGRHGVSSQRKGASLGRGRRPRFARRALARQPDEEAGLNHTTEFGP